MVDAPDRCSCYPIPALRCNACSAVFAPAADETAMGFHKRVRLHAMVHPEGAVSFTQGKTTPTKPEGAE
jgi:hypothetical protein